MSASYDRVSSQNSSDGNEGRQLVRRSGSFWSCISGLFERNPGGLPPSNPRGWPNSGPEEIAERPKRIIKAGSPQIYGFCNNFVKTSKYELWDFLPKFLLEEFNPRTKIANCYFLMISGLQCIPPISNTNGYPTTLIPLMVVVFVDALFQIFEDLSRHRADTAANASTALRYNDSSNRFENCKWFEISVGDYLKIPSRGQIPADVLIISVSEKSEPAQGICYVETKSLDGETNLKIRTALPATLAKIKNESDLGMIRGDIEMEHPNKLIDSFNGVADFGKLGRDPIQHSNVLLRGCVLRNTDWVYGLVVNTGHDTKIMMSSRSTRAKTSKLESTASEEIKRIIILLALVCFAGATGQAIWNTTNDVQDITYLDWKIPSKVGYWFIDFFYFFLLHATFIPVSLYVSMSISRSFQSYFMNSDLDMYYEKTDTPAIVRTMTLNEELGQISHVFSDKTGTLTCNVMDFRKASINGVIYGEGITEIGKAAWKLQGKPISAKVLDAESKAKANAVPHVSFYCSNYDKDMAAGGVQKEKNKQFFRFLAICHDIIPEKIDGKLKLSASNPDDEALVCAADYFGYSFTDRRDKFCIVFDKENSVEEEVELLATIEFSSKRKRMSVIIRDTDHQIKVLTKGADTVMLPRLKAGQDAMIRKTEQDMIDFAVEGLRCLYIAQSIIKEKDYFAWADAYRAARTDLSQIEMRKKGQPNKIEDLEDSIEQNLMLIGATAIEDRLQDGVPECVAELAKAGINIWVLTGDKEETAINIAVACNLLLPKEYMDHIIINPTIASDLESIKQLILDEINKREAALAEEEDVVDIKPQALIIDGPSLIIAMADHGERGARELLLQISQQCKAVVACRVSPDQKREMVHLIKTGLPYVRTLAIGDGANDVAMIQEAHIGVGIKGEEGLQAVNSADYAIAQFRYLSDLMLKHGRYNYIRMSYLVSYMFYKNILMSIAQFWFNFNCAFSGQKYYTEGAIQLYNLAYTSIPILLLTIYDMDVSRNAVHHFPQLYQAGVNDDYFNTISFWQWLISAILESIVLSVLPLFTLSNGDYRTGNEEQFLQAGMTCLTAIVISVNMKIFFIQSRYYTVTIGVIFASILIYFASLFFITSFVALDANFFQVWTRLVQTGTFWLTLLLLITIIYLKDVYFTGMRRNFAYSPHHIIQEMEINGTLDYRSDHNTLEEEQSNSPRANKNIEVEMASPNKSKAKGQTKDEKERGPAFAI